MYANLRLHELEKIRKLEEEMGVILVAYNERERGRVSSQVKSTSALR